MWRIHICAITACVIMRIFYNNRCSSSTAHANMEHEHYISSFRLLGAMNFCLNIYFSFNRGHDKNLTSFMIFLVEEEILFLGRSTRQPSICKTFCFLTLWASEAIISQVPIFKEKIIFSHILWNFLQMQLAKPVKTVQLFARYTIIEINSHYCLANVSWRPLWLLTCW